MNALARQHAEELVEALREYLPLLEATNSRELSEGAVGMGPELERAKRWRDLLTRLDEAAPGQPQPPTLLDALTMLSELRGAMRTGFYANSGQRADELIERARRAGLL